MHLHHVQIMIPPGGEDEAIGFYGGLLGLTRIPRPDVLPRPGVWFRCGDLEVHLGVQERMPEAESRAHVAFAVPDPEIVHRRITGADFDARWAEPLDGRRRFHTRDPFGNRLEFIEDPT